jgi:hypothetical protein
MKTIPLFVLLLTATAFNDTPEKLMPVSARASQALADQLVLALQENSADKYVELAPSLADLKKVMDAHEAIYGDHLPEAKKVFEVEYEKVILPAARKAFDGLIAEGKRRGIDWRAVTLVRWQAAATTESELQPHLFSIVVTHADKHHTIEIEKAFFLNGRWRVSQFIKLI